jgi:hypothetical protein
MKVKTGVLLLPCVFLTGIIWIKIRIMPEIPLSLLIGFIVWFALFVLVFSYLIQKGEKWVFRLHFYSVHDYFYRLQACREHMTSLLKMNEFIAFLSGLWNEFFNATDFFILILHETEKWYRVISVKEDHFYRLENQADKLVQLLHPPLPEKGSASEKDPKRDEILKILNQPSHINHLLRLNGKGFICVFSFYSPRLFKKQEMTLLSENHFFIRSCLDQIHYYEQSKNAVLEHLGMRNGRNWDVQELSNQNLILQHAYDRIKKLQDELLIKEKKAAVIKFAISLDDEISNPLTNLVVAIQYHLKKFISGEKLETGQRQNLLDIIIMQSLRIKSILDQLREVTDGHFRKTDAVERNPLDTL